MNELTNSTKDCQIGLKSKIQLIYYLQETYFRFNDKIGES